jgi:hypothetical protein
LPPDEEVPVVGPAVGGVTAAGATGAAGDFAAGAGVATGVATGAAFAAVATLAAGAVAGDWAALRVCAYNASSNIPAETQVRMTANLRKFTLAPYRPSLRRVPR